MNSSQAIPLANLKDREGAVQRAQEAVEVNAADAAIRNDMAWTFANTASVKMRAPERAVEWAMQAVKLAPNERMCQLTLGTALCRAGDSRAAIEALKRSMRMSSGGDGYDSVFLAMAHGQLGESDPARDWFNKAKAWAAKQNPKDKELEGFLKEAAALLGRSSN